MPKKTSPDASTSTAVADPPDQTAVDLPELRLAYASELLDSPFQPKERLPGGALWSIQDLVGQGAAAVFSWPAVICRPSPEDRHALQVVAGHRRKHAAIALGVARVPVDVRELDDRQARHVQWAENAARDDLHPLLEAEQLQELVKAGMTQEVIAAERGKGQPWVSKRLSLTQLSAKSRKAYLASEISGSVALVLARIPVHKLQDKALQVTLKGDNYGGRMGGSQARQLVKRDYTLDLGTAQFDTNDAELVKAAGACSTCPKRSQNQGALFEADEGDVCTDPDCWSGKQKAHGKRTLAAAKKNGLEVLKKTQDLFKRSWEGASYSLSWEAEKKWVSLDGQVDYGPHTYRVRLREDMPPVTVATSPDGQVWELVNKKDADKVLKRSQPTVERKKKTDAEKAKATKERHGKELRRRTESALMANVTAAASKDLSKGKERGLWLALFDLALSLAWAVVENKVCARREIGPSGGSRTQRHEGRHSALRAYAKKVSTPDLRGLVLELLWTLDNEKSMDQASFRAAAKSLGVDRKKVEATQSKAIAAEGAAKKAAKKKSKKTAKKKAKVTKKGKAPKKKAKVTKTRRARGRKAKK